MKHIFKLITLIVVFSFVTIQANPTDPSVIAGEAACLQYGHNLQVTTSDQAIIHWQDFSIAANERTEFVQPNAHSAVLNRVTGDNLSEIHGTLQANGKVYFINPNGVIVGSSGIVDVSSFIASTLDITNEEFMNRGEISFKGPGKASIVNLGVINARDGDVVMIAFNVQNDGEIHAANGLSGLATGNNILLKPAGEERIFVHVSLDDDVEKAGIGIENNGCIESLKAELKSDGNLYAMAINTEGYINATGVEERDGAIYLVAKGGLVDINGNLTAKNADTGGTIHILGNLIDVWDETYIDVSGENGGGEVLIGGDKQWKNPDVYSSQRTFLSDDAVIVADAKKNGMGGKVILWSDGDMYCNGSISAKGGSQGGDGGFMEVSGKGMYCYSPKAISALASKGNNGHLLLDPTDITMNITGPTTDGFTNPYDGGTNATATLKISDVTDALVNANVTIMTSPGGANPGIITIANDITWGTTNTLSITADHQIIMNAGVTIRNFNADGVNFDALMMTTLATAPAAGSLVGFSMLNGPASSISTIDGNIAITATSPGNSGTDNLWDRDGRRVYNNFYRIRKYWHNRNRRNRVY